MSDLTSQVDFDALSRVARRAGGKVAPVRTQGDFLVELGLLERAGQLGKGKSAAVQARLTSEAERLALPGQMGSLFKVMAIAGSDFSLPLFDMTQS